MVSGTARQEWSGVYGKRVRPVEAINSLLLIMIMIIVRMVIAVLPGISQPSQHASQKKLCR